MSEMQLPPGTPVKVAGFTTPAVVHFYRKNLHGVVRVSVRFLEVTEEITWAAGPGPFYLNVSPDRISTTGAR